jgi:CHAD domain-containing protein
MTSDSRSVEREIKLAVGTGFNLPDLRGVVAGTVRLPEQQTRALYFDTPDLRLWRVSVTLRHRSGEGPGEGTWTLKVPIADEGPTLDRTELTWPGGPDSIPEEAAGIVRGIVRRASLVQVAELLATRRRLALHDTGGASFGEIDDDTVTVVMQDGESRRFRQIELELGNGGPAVMDAVIDELLRAGAQRDGEPKLGKALRMAGRQLHAHEPVIVHRHSSMAEVVKASIRQGLDRLLEHDIRLRLDATDPASYDVHQARVATRRLRSDLKLLGRELDPVWLVHTRDELKWLGGVLGSVRDADVLSGSLLTADSVIEAGGTLELRARLEGDRRMAARDLAATLDDPRYLGLLDGLDAASALPPLVPAGGKRHRHHGKGADAAARKVLPGLVKRRLRSLRRTVRASGRQPSDSQLHQIRIRAKQLRYAAETATPIIGEPARRMAVTAEELQTVLGEHHDAVAAEQWLRHQALSGTRSAAFSAGVLVAGERRRQHKLRHRWRAVWVRLDGKGMRRSLQ